MIYKIGSKGEFVKDIQEVVGAKADGDFGPHTEKLVIIWQKCHGLKPDGLVGRNTIDLMGIAATDLQEQYYITDNGLLINRHYLPKGEFIQGPIKNEYAFIHHTAGWQNPYRVIDSWGRDSRGRVATEFVLGGQKITDCSDSSDGVMVQAFPEGCQGWHLGKTGSPHMARHSVALEVCAFGYLKNGKTYVGTKAHKDQISTLSEPFRGFTQWHKYSDTQIKAIEKWIHYIGDRDNIDMREGLVQWIKSMGPNKAFDFQKDAYYGKVKGLLTHTNVRKDKYDNFPQQELVDMLLSI